MASVHVFPLGGAIDPICSLGCGLKRSEVEALNRAGVNMHEKKNPRVVTHNGVTYEARREALKRDGGDPPGQWYWTVEDGTIDQRVPDGHYSTLHNAKRALMRKLGIGVL